MLKYQCGSKTVTNLVNLTISKAIYTSRYKVLLSSILTCLNCSSSSKMADLSMFSQFFLIFKQFLMLLSAGKVYRVRHGHQLCFHWNVGGARKNGTVMIFGIYGSPQYHRERQLENNKNGFWRSPLLCLRCCQRWT